MTSIRIADDHSVVRAGIRALIERLVGVRVVAEASNGVEAIELVKAHGPHVALMDIAMPAMNGLEALARITRDYPAHGHAFHACQRGICPPPCAAARRGISVKDAAVAESNWPSARSPGGRS